MVGSIMFVSYVGWTIVFAVPGEGGGHSQFGERKTKAKLVGLSVERLGRGRGGGPESIAL